MRANRIYLLLALLFCFTTGFGQTKSPKEFLGYEIGEQFTPHHKIVAYFEHVAATNSMVQFEQYGESYEKRPLFVVYVSSANNIANLENIRKDNLKRVGLESGAVSTQVPIVWMSYNVHGNEAVGSETAMMTLWELIDPSQSHTKTWLEKSLVVIDPCLNPDGHSRYVNWYVQKANRQLTADPRSIEHSEPWPGGRPNHYLFDLNRDWAWQVQKESQVRNALYDRWMPHLHVDFHEQGVNSPYFFVPAAEPVHAFVAPYQKDFQHIIGKNIAKNFDKHAWLYFTREVFDLFYPSYGDTWPTFNGAIGMTFEQGGSGRAGLGILTDLGDTLTLHDRIIHHHTSGMASIEVAYQHGTTLLDEFEKFFKNGAKNPVGDYKTYVVKAGQTPARLQALALLLDKNGIRYGYAKSKQDLKGFRYFNGKTEGFKIEENDLVVSALQPKSVLTQTLFDPNPILNDSVTYDITSWALPFVYSLESYALENAMQIDLNAKPTTRNVSTANADSEVPLAYVSPWNAAIHGKFLTKLLEKGIRVRYASKDFSVSGHSFKAGSLIVGREGNEKIQDFHNWVQKTASAFEIAITPVFSGFVDSGSDFGSSDVRAIKAQKIALVGTGVSSLGLGEIWHYLEQELEHPFSMLDMAQIGSSNLSNYDVLIMPSGSYAALGENGYQNLSTWIAGGGKVIAIESAVSGFVGKPGFGISRYFSEDEKKSFEKEMEKSRESQHLIPYASRERAGISSTISGAIFEIKVDATHPLGYGTDGRYFTLKNSASRYAFLKNGVNVGILPSADYLRSGFVGQHANKGIEKSLVFGVEQRGRGEVIYFVDNPLFRGFWEGGKLLFNNALFMVGQ